MTAGGLRSEYREYLGIKVCEIDPKPVTEDLRRMNDFLARFLEATAAGQGGSLTDEQLDTLGKAPKTLGPALSAHAALVKRVAACKELKGNPVQEEARRGQDLVTQAKARLNEAPRLIALQKAAQDLRAWKEKQETEQQSERANWCPPKPTRNPEIYYAWEDEQGQTEWLFCDGSKVVSAAGGTPEWVASQEKKAPKPAPAQTYLTSASRFPAKEIRRAPRPSDEGAPAAAPEAAPKKDEGAPPPPPAPK